MSKHYGICMADCDISGEIGDISHLETTALVLIVYVNEENGCYSIKMMDSGLKGISNKIYQCESKNICIIQPELVPYLLIADYWGRLEILRFKKKILGLKPGSKVKLQVIYNDCRRFIDCEVLHIGPRCIDNEGYYVFINLLLFENLDDKLLRAIYSTLGEANGILFVKVEKLFSEIEIIDPQPDDKYLNSLQYHYTNASNTSNNKSYSEISSFKKNPNIYSGTDDTSKYELMHNYQEPMNADSNNYNNKSYGEISFFKNNPNTYSGTDDTSKYESMNNYQEPMNVDSINYNNNKSNKEEHNQNYSKYRDSNYVNIRKNGSKMCMGCSAFQSLFTFPCGDPFCSRCILQRLDYIKCDSRIKCPSCHLKLQFEDEHRFNAFLDQNLKEEEQNQFKTERVSYDHSVQNPVLHSNEILKGIDNENLEHIPKMCLKCNKFENLFTFPCTDVFCYYCLLNQLDRFKRNQKPKCPNCGMGLEKKELECLDSFITLNISKEEASKDKQNFFTKTFFHSKSNEKNGCSYNKEKKNESSVKEKKSKSGGNKIESRFCKSCKTTNKYSALSCTSCNRPLGSNDYSFGNAY